MPNVGQTVRVRAKWTAESAPADPGEINALVLSPSGEVSSATVTHVGVGEDYVEVQLTEEGLWWVRFEGTVPVPTADEILIDVEHSVFPVPAEV